MSYGLHVKRRCDLALELFAHDLDAPPGDRLRQALALSNWLDPLGRPWRPVLPLSAPHLGQVGWPSSSEASRADRRLTRRRALLVATGYGCGERQKRLHLSHLQAVVRLDCSSHGTSQRRV